jgi:hypothetical protein
MKEIISIALQAADAQGFSICGAAISTGRSRAEVEVGW